jgi:3-oxoacyl-[acyl-carrier-protein] synthase III
MVDFDFCFPSSRASVARMSAECGVPQEDILKITVCPEFPALGEGEQAWTLTLDAARTLLKRGAATPEQIRYVIYAGSGEWDVPFWSPAAKVAHELGVADAHCFEVTNFCNAGMTAVRIACEKLERDGDGYALVLIGDRLSRMLDYSDPDSKDLFNFGDSGAAVLVTAGDAPFEVVASRMRTDASWSDYYYGENGPDGVRIRRAEHREGLTEAYVGNFVRLTGEALGELGRSIDDVAYFLINHGDSRMHRRLLTELGLSEDRTVFNYERLAHMGGADTLIALQDLVTAGRLAPGDLILLATSAMGFSWGITAVVYRG